MSSDGESPGDQGSGGPRRRVHQDNPPVDQERQVGSDEGKDALRRRLSNRPRRPGRYQEDANHRDGGTPARPRAVALALAEVVQERTAGLQTEIAGLRREVEELMVALECRDRELLEAIWQERQTPRPWWRRILGA